jgi:hypothetical protein
MQGTSYDYEIHVEGRLGAQWTQWFDGIQVVAGDCQSGQTALIVPAEDPALLFGVIAQIGALNLKLVSIERKARTVTGS